MTFDEPAQVSLITTVAPAAAACELCTAATLPPTTSLIVNHARGGTVELAACDWCVQAIRRLSAVTGGRAAFVLSEAVGPPPTALPSTPRGSRPISPPVLISELTQQIQATDGARYVIRVYGRERVDGTWEGWLEFVAVGAAVVWRTDRETTQSNREDLAYWARGLEPTYLQGAFSRARRQ